MTQLVKVVLANYNAGTALCHVCFHVKMQIAINWWLLRYFKSRSGTDSTLLLVGLYMCLIHTVEPSCSIPIQWEWGLRHSSRGDFSSQSNSKHSGKILWCFLLLKSRDYRQPPKKVHTQSIFDLKIFYFFFVNQDFFLL